MPAPPPPPGKGRTFRTKLEPWMTKVVCNALVKGMPLSTCAGLIQVTKATLIRWRQLGSDEACTDPALLDFAVAIEEARAQAIETGVELLAGHAPNDWRAADALLRNMDPETFSPAQRSKVEVEMTLPKQRDLSLLSDDELLLLEQLENKIAMAKALPANV